MSKSICSEEYTKAKLSSFTSSWGPRLSCLGALRIDLQFIERLNDLALVLLLYHLIFVETSPPKSKTIFLFESL